MPAHPNTEPVVAIVAAVLGTALAALLGGWDAGLAAAAALAVVLGVVLRQNARVRGLLALRDRLYRRLFEADGIDPLTGAFNRRRLDDELRRQLALAQRNRSRVAVLALDLGGFDGAVDAHGRATGDEMVLDAHEVLREELRASDLIARADADSFLVVLPEADEDTARIVVGKLIRSLRGVKRAKPDGALIDLSASIGMAISDPGDRAEGPELLARAERALAAAQDAGGDRFAVDEPVATT
jgi:diguanylate cyclase (GGDEF)-like protein